MVQEHRRLHPWTDTDAAKGSCFPPETAPRILGGCSVPSGLGSLGLETGQCVFPAVCLAGSSWLKTWAFVFGPHDTEGVCSMMQYALEIWE